MEIKRQKIAKRTVNNKENRIQRAENSLFDYMLL